MIIITKAHPVAQAMSARPITQAELLETGQYRNPGEPNAEQSASSEYSKPRMRWRGLTIAIENPAGSVRRGRNRHGVTWEQRMLYDYGEILGSMGVDGDPVDVFIGPNLDAPKAYVVHQRRVNDWDNYDEDKCMIGFDSEDEARAAFLSCYSDPRFLGPITTMIVDDFVAKVRATKEKPAMIKSILFFKGFVGPYLRGGKIVNVSGYHGRNARPKASPGQMSLFGSNTPTGPSPYKGKDPVASTPDMFSEHPPEKVAWAKKVIANRDYMPWQDVNEAHEVLGIKDEDAEWANQQLAAAKKDVVTTPRDEMIAEHERLVQVLNSPSREDDKVEAKKQAAELNEYRGGEGTPDHLLADIPGAKWRRGKGLIAGHYGVDVNGEVVGNYHAKPEDAVAEAKQALANRDQWAKDKAARTEAIGKLRDRLMSGGEATDQDLQLLGLRAGSSGLEWFIPAAAEAFGVNSRAVRPHIRDLIRIGHTDMGAKKEFVEPKKALQALAAGLKPNADYNAAVTSTKEGPTDDNPRRKFYVTVAREGRGVAKLAGPFDTHDEAKAHVHRAREAAHQVDPRSAFDAFGTAGIEADEHKPGVLNERLGIGAKPTAYTPVTTDDHPAPIPRSLLSMIPEDRRDEWKDLHRQQHELHHYELGQVREKLDRLRSKRNKAESALREAEAARNSLRGAPVPDPAREAEAQKMVDQHHANFTKLTREQDGLVGQHQALHEKISKLGRAKERISAGSGDLDMDWAAMRKHTAAEQQDHEKSMLKRYRDHYKAQDEERKRSKGALMTKAIVFMQPRKS